MTQHGHTVANTTGKQEQTTKQRCETRRAPDNHHCGLPVVGMARPYCLVRMAVRLPLVPIRVFLSCPFVFQRNFPVYAAKKSMYLATKRT